MKGIFKIFLIFLTFSSCEKTLDISVKDSINDFYLPATITCDSTYAPFYTSCNIDNQAYCSNNVANLATVLINDIDYTTTGPSSTDSIIDGPFRFLKFGILTDFTQAKSPMYLRFISPPFHPDTKIKMMVDSIFVEGKIFEINRESFVITKKSTEKHKFNIELRVDDYSKNILHEVNTATGPQDNMFVKFDKVTKSSDNIYDYYTIEMSFECNLYFRGVKNLIPGNLWGEVRKGKHKATYGILKSE